MVEKIIHTYDNEFLAKYNNVEPPWGPLGWVTYKRTYARWIPSENRTETWVETCKRVLEGNYNLVPNDPTITQDEMEKAFDWMFNMLWLPPGRGLWMSGTDHSRKNGSSMNNCVSGNTLVHTQDGLVEARELVGKKVPVLSQGGVYRLADWDSYGKQELFRVLFSNGDEIEATSGHEWVVSGRVGRVITSDLVGHSVPMQHLSSFIYDEGSYREGVRHGLVFGDGTLGEGHRRSQMVQFGETRTLVREFFENATEQRPSRYPEGVTYVGGLPATLKSLPDVKEGKSYLRGFIAGLIAADGYVNKGGGVYLHNSSLDTLVEIRRIAAEVGIIVSSIGMEREFNPWSGERSPIYRMTFVKASMYDEHMILKTSHRTNMFSSPKPKKQLTRKVVAVIPTGRVEEVYCCHEPETNTWVAGPGYLTGNCWFVAVRPEKYRQSDENGPRASFPFAFAMDMLMLGGGVGFSVTNENARKFSRVKNAVDLVIVCDPKHQNIKELDAAYIPPRDRTHTFLRVPDTREGWGRALAIMVDAHWKGYEDEYVLVLDVSEVRPSGRRIKGFGGTASGPGPLVDMLRAINGLLNSRVGKGLTPIDCTDIMNFIGKCVVAGNVRRSSEIALGPVNKKFINMKQDQKALMSHRWASNNSVVIDDSVDDFTMVAKALSNNGEPGVFNLERSKHYGRFIDGRQENIDSAVEGTNPCGEISLESGECCNLVELFPAKCREAGVDLHEVARIAYRYAKRVTFAPQTWEISRRVIEKNRRIGVSISGWEDLKAMLKAEGCDDSYRRDFLNSLYEVVREEDKKYSALLGVNESIKKTTVKPSGSVSLLNGSSPGRHAHESKHYIRRIRMQSKDPLVEVLTDAGFHIEDDAYSPNTVVVEFPVKAPTADLEGFKAANEYSLEEQCEDQMELQTYWADNSVSSTLKFSADEVPLISDVLCKYRFKSTSMLPYSDHGYVQAPYEPITQERYDDMTGRIKFWPTEAHMSKEKRDMELIAQDECATGACPIK